MRIFVSIFGLTFLQVCFTQKLDFPGQIIQRKFESKFGSLFVKGLNIIGRPIFLGTIKHLFGPHIQFDPRKPVPLPNGNNPRLVRLEDAKHYVHFAAASCHGEEDLYSFNCHECILTGQNVVVTHVIQNATTRTLAYISLDTDRQEIVVTYRATHGPREFVLDFQAEMFKSPLGDGAQLHRGFYEETMSLYSTVSNIIKSAYRKYPNYGIVFTGHSSGGVMATMTYYFLNAELPNLNYTLVTFGEPRSGNGRFADIINSGNLSSARVVNGYDIVPHFIPWSLGYVHHQNEYWILPREIQICSNQFYEDTKCSGSLAPAKHLLSDHFSYFDSIFELNCIRENPIGTILGILHS